VAKGAEETVMEIFGLCDIVRQTSFDIHCFHRHGHLEKVYENALVHRLRELGLDVKQQHPLTVLDEDGTVIGDYYADLMLEGSLIVELKAVRALADEHVAQILGYLRSSRMEHGLLINFGAPKLQVKKYILTQELELRPAFSPWHQ
jgi:GxxExxY protein